MSLLKKGVQITSFRFSQNFSSSDHKQENEKFSLNGLKMLNFIYDSGVEDMLQKKYERSTEMARTSSQ